MNKIQPTQIRNIYAISRTLGLDNEELHSLVEAITEKTSIKALGETEAIAVIGELKKRQRSAGIEPPKRKSTGIDTKPGGVTKEQQAKMWALIGELERLDRLAGKEPCNHRKRLCGVIKKACGVDAAEKNPFAWINMHQGILTIDLLKRIVENEEKKACREGRVKSG